MKQLLFILLVTPMLLSASTPTRRQIPPAERHEFAEIWGYLMRGEEKHLRGSEPFTDIGYFSLWINAKGRVSEPPARPKLTTAAGQPRIHLVITELTSPGFTHFCINGALPVRERIIADIVEYSRDFDGVQIDFEQVIQDDRENFLEFLSLIRERLPKDKLFSVAVPARRSVIPGDQYDYSAIGRIADRVIIMAYDQHWSTSKPGPVAGLTWCADVEKFASERIPAEKLVMGLPLYGRAWSNTRGSRSLKYSDTAEIISKRRPKLKFSPATGPYFQYRSRGRVTVFYDDTASLLDKISLYRNRGVQAISFWRIGQGPSDIWPRLAAAVPQQKERPTEEIEVIHAAAHSSDSLEENLAERKAGVSTEPDPANARPSLSGTKDASALAK